MTDTPTPNTSASTPTLATPVTSADVEVAVVLGYVGPRYWHAPPEATSVSIPDSARLWREIWSAFEEADLFAVAHSHPWVGQAAPSRTDIETFKAIELALGCRIIWIVVTYSDLVALKHNGVSDEAGGAYEAFEVSRYTLLDWVEELRARSRGEVR